MTGIESATDWLDSHGFYAEDFDSPEDFIAEVAKVLPLEYISSIYKDLEDEWINFVSDEQFDRYIKTISDN